MFTSLSQNNGFVFVNLFSHFIALSHFFQHYKIGLGLWQASKTFYRKLKNTQNVLEEFQRLSRFPTKVVLYSSINFCILNAWAIISNFIRFDLDFWQASKPFYRKLKYREKGFWRVSTFPSLSQKNDLDSSTNFFILKPWGIMSNFIRFDLGFWQALNSFFR